MCVEGGYAAGETGTATLWNPISSEAEARVTPLAVKRKIYPIFY